jgi:protease-4
VGEVLTVSADWHYTSDRHSPPAEFFFRLMPVKGLAVQAMVNWDLSFGVGLFFDLANFGVGAATSIAKSDFSGMTYMGRVSAKRYRPVFERSNKAVVLTINESLDSRRFRGIESLLGLGGRSYLDVISDIDRARRDRSVEAIVLKIEENPLDLDQSDEIVRALLQFKARGGKVYAYLESGGNSDYLLATSADAIFIAPAGVLLVGGVKADLTFFKGTLEKLDVKVQTVRDGKYKSFVEMFTRDGASPESLEQLRAAISDFNGALAARMSAARGFDTKTAKRLMDLGLFDAKTALAEKLVDAIIYDSDIEKEIMERAGHHLDLTERYFDTRPRKTGWDVDPVVAVLNIEGSIVSGEGSPGFLGFFNSTGSTEICDAARAIARDVFIKAAVVRINSPGGSGLAGDTMWKCISDIRKVKPVVVSMGSVAASAGYLVAVPANFIYADPFTLTGSIGVWSIKPNITGLAAKLGITHQTVKITKAADIESLWRDLDEEELARLQKMTDAFYQHFKERVSAGRSLTFAEVEAVGQGRIWSGEEAMKLRLVDGIGGVEDAFDKARELAGMAKGRSVRVVEFPDRPGLLKTLRKRLLYFADPASAIKKELRDLSKTDAKAGLPYNVEMK